MPVDPNGDNEEHNYSSPGACELTSHSSSSSSLSSSVSVTIPEKTRGVGPSIIHRVPPEMRLSKEKSQHLFDPVIVSLGPYHHRESHLDRAEKLKDEILCKYISDSGLDKGFFYNRILEEIDEIRECYVGVSKDDYDDAVLTEMMLRDGVFTIYCMDVKEAGQYLFTKLGVSGISFIKRDMFMLENQVPYLVIDLLILLLFEEDEGRERVRTFLSHSCFGDDTLTKLPWEEDDDMEEPLHILDAARMTLLMKKEAKHSRFHGCCKCIWPWNQKTEHTFERESNPFRSVTDLVRKGIHFKPSSFCLTDVRFSSYVCYGHLHLPKWFATAHSKVFFSNLVAFEMSPDAYTDGDVTSYINFMKALIESTEDVKKLREKKILFSTLGTEEEVVKLFKDIDTLGMGNSEIFGHEKKKMDRHCSSRSRTWMADLLHTYFQSPWTATALLAAILLLFLTFSQTYLALLSHLSEHKMKTGKLNTLVTLVAE